ncbi:MAG: hypothetical protein ACYC5A_05280 [Thermoleophilia bacterium]
MTDFQLDPGEEELGSWTLNYLPPGGGRYTGKLVVTGQRLLFDAKFDTSLGGVIDQLMKHYGQHGYLSIPKTDIKAVSRKSSMLKKRVTVTLIDGTEHVFDYGMLSIDKLAAAIESGSA